MKIIETNFVINLIDSENYKQNCQDRNNLQNQPNTYLQGSANR